MTKCTNPNFNTWLEQNAWEADMCAKLNNGFNVQNIKYYFVPSNDFENRYRHTDCFLCDSNNKHNIHRVDFKTVKWNSKSDHGANSRFSVNVTCFGINSNNPTQIFIFIGEKAEYAYFVSADKIITDEIKSVICSGNYGNYGYFSFNKTKYENSSDYILFENDYIKNNAFYQFQ